MDTTLLKGLNVLEALARSGADRSVTELASELGMVRSNVHRTLQTLIHAGYAEHVPDSVRYRPTLRVWSLGVLVERRLDVRAWARPFLERLAAKTGETTLLTVSDGREVVFVDKVESQHPVNSVVAIGARAPMHCTAPGKAILAFSGVDIAATLPATLPRFSPTTITKRSELIGVLEGIRKQGYSISQGEYREGVNGVAAPVFGAPGRVLAAINLSGPNSRLGKRELRKLGEDVSTAARAISDRMTG